MKPLIAMLLTCCLAACELKDIPDPGADSVDVAAGGDDAMTQLDAVDGVADAADAIGCALGCPFHQSCVGSECVAKACQSDSACNDPGATEEQTFYCFHGKCAGFQCAVDADCATPQKCNTLTYKCYTPATGCGYDAMCDDKDGCTVDTCDKPTGNCLHALAAGCCKTEADCGGSSGCVIATCTAGTCDWQAKPACCGTDNDCADGNPCTSDACVGGQCKFTANASCCQNASGCDDDDASSTDLCVKNQCVHQFAGLATTCASSAACPGNACLGGTCVAGQCSYSAKSGSGCCSEDSQCAADKACQVDTCSAHQCVHAPAQGKGTHVWWHFDTGMDGWVADKAHPSTYWHQSALIYVQGGGALRYGIPNQISFETGNANKGAALSPAFTVPKAPAALQGWVYLDLEPGTAVHTAGIDVVSAGVTTTLWSKVKDMNGSTTSQAWKPVAVDLSPWSGKSVQVRVWFDSVKYDTSNKNKMGFVVDELEVTGACP